MSLETLRDALPDYAKDLPLNLAPCPPNPR